MLCLPRNLHIEAHQLLYLPRDLHFEVHQVLCLPRNLHFEVHKVLCLPRNLHIEVHQVLYLPRNLHFEVRQVLHLPRNLHIEGHRVLCLPRNLQTSHISKSQDSLHLSTKSELLDDHHHVQSAAPAKKPTFRSKTEVSLAPATKVTTMCQNAHGATTRAQSKCILTISRGMNAL